MNTENASKPTGRRYGSVEELMEGNGISQEVQAKVEKLKSETAVTLHLARLRQMKGITQEKMAELIGVTQSAVSKIESGADDDLTLGIIKQYAKATKISFGMEIGKRPTHVEAVKTNVSRMKYHLEALAKIANQHEELQNDIEAFFSEALNNILSILAKCSRQLPLCGGAEKSEVEISVVKTDIKIPSAKAKEEPPMPLAV